MDLTYNRLIIPLGIFFSIILIVSWIKNNYILTNPHTYLSVIILATFLIKFVEQIRYKDLEIKLARKALEEDVKKAESQIEKIEEPIEKIQKFAEDDDYLRIESKFIKKDYISMVFDITEVLSRILVEIFDEKEIKPKKLTFGILIKEAYREGIIIPQIYEAFKLINSTRNKVAHIHLNRLIPDSEMETIFFTWSLCFGYLQSMKSRSAQ